MTQSLSWYLDVRKSIAFVGNTLSVCHLALQSSLSALARRRSVDPFARQEVNECMSEQSWSVETEERIFENSVLARVISDD